MAAVCASPSVGVPLLPGLADYVDCHARSLGELGFQALAGGPLLPALLGGCLTVYVALIGYRLILGGVFDVKDALLAALRIGLILTFCMRWPAYEAVFYRTAVDGPAEVSASILGGSEVPALGATDLAARLENAYRAIARQPAFIPAPAQAQPSQGQQAQPQAVAAPAATQAQELPPSFSGTVFLVSALGGVLAARFAAGLLLALGPMVIALALFDTFLGLFEGWVRALFGVALGLVGATVVSGLELGFVEGRLLDAGVETAFTEQGLMMTALLFLPITLAVLTAAAVLAFSFRLRLPRLGALWPSATPAFPAGVSRPPAEARPRALAPEAPTRARAVADAVLQHGRRETAAADLLGSSGPGAAMRRTPPGQGRSEAAGAPVPIGQSLRRAAAGRRTLTAQRRDASR